MERRSRTIDVEARACEKSITRKIDLRGFHLQVEGE
jgi:hypothetical protein